MKRRLDADALCENSGCGRCKFLETPRSIVMRSKSLGPQNAMEGVVMRVILAQPRGFCAGVVRAIDIVEKALDKYGEPVYVRHEIVHNKHVVETLQEQGRALRRGTGRSARRRRDGVQRPWRAAVGGQDRAGARAAGARRHLPAGFQGAQPGQALCRPGPHPDPDRPCRPSRSGRHHGPGRRAGASGVSPKPMSTTLDLPTDTPVAYVTQTTLSIDDTKGIIVALQETLPRHRRPGDLRHLLRHPEPPDARCANLPRSPM